MKNVNKYNKFWVALGAVFAVLATSFNDGSLSQQEILNVGIAVVAAIGVFATRNEQ